MLAIVMSVAVGSTLAITAFGVASLRTGAHSRPVGGFLLVMAASEVFNIIAMLVFGDPTPPWVGFVVSVLFATSLGSIGTVLRKNGVQAETPDAIGEVTTG